MRVRCAGLRVLDDRLWYAPIRYRPRPTRLRFEPEALIVCEGSRQQALTWDEAFPTSARPGEWGWWVYEVPRDLSPAVVVVRDKMASFLPAHDGLGYSHEAQRWKIASGFGLRGLVDAASIAAIALTQYFACTPHVRPAAAEPERLRQLVDELRTENHWLLPPGAAIGREADIERVVATVLDGLWPRRFCGYGVRGEHQPTHADVHKAVVTAMPAWLHTYADEGRVHRAMSKLVPDQAWPFDVLHAGPGRIDEDRD